MTSLNSTGVDLTSENLLSRSGWCLRWHARCNVRCVHADSGPSRHLPAFLNLTCSGRDSSDWSLHIMPPLIRDSSASNGYWGPRRQWLMRRALALSVEPNSSNSGAPQIESCAGCLPPRLDRNLPPNLLFYTDPDRGNRIDSAYLIASWFESVYCG